MMTPELTEGASAATLSAMQGEQKMSPRSRWMALIYLAATVSLAGCISVDAPDGPIVIELNINIKQEVIYRLAEDAGNTIEENADIF